MRFLPLALLAVLSGHVYAGDSTSTTTSPTVNSSNQTKGAACTRPQEQAVTTAGDLLTCYGGTWKETGMNGYEKVTDTYYRTAADNYTTVVRSKACSPGKVLINAGCNFNGGTNQHGVGFYGALNDYTALCFYKLHNAYDPAYPGGIENSLVTTAYCADPN